MKKFLSLALCAVLLLALMPMLTQTVSAESLSKFDIRLDEPIASYTPDFTPEFNTDAQVYTSVTWQENSPGFSTKLGSSDEFKPGLSYKAVIWVWFGDGYNLATDKAGDLAAALTVNGKAISSLEIKSRNSRGQIVEVMITCEYGPLSGMEISRAQVTGIPSPVAGNMPIYSFTLGSNNAYGFYHTHPVTWWDKTTGTEMDSGDTFVAGHIYQVEIWLAANREQGFTFRLDSYGKPNVNVTLNSWAADSVITAYEQDPREVLTAYHTFEACPAAHVCSPKLVPQQDPTCLMYGFKAYYECSCGLCFADAKGQKPITDMDGYGIIPALGHAEGSWSFNGTHHYKKCTRCQEIIPGTTAAHSGGKATCETDGICTVCRYAYIKASEDYHVPDTSKWIARVDMYHFHKCSICGAHCDIEDHRWSPKYHPVNASGHAYQCADCKGYDQVHPHNPGPEATADTPQTCKDCGYIIEPAKNHQHDLTKVPQTPATCTQEGNIEYYVCTGCNDCFTDAAGKNKIPETMSVEIGALGHTPSDTWSMDEEMHWRTCETCKAILEETHMHHEFAEGVCTTCSYQLGSEITPDQPTEPTQDVHNTEKTTGSDNTEEGIDWVMILIIGLVCFGAAVTFAVIILKKKK